MKGEKRIDPTDVNRRSKDSNCITFYMTESEIDTGVLRSPVPDEIPKLAYFPQFIENALKCTNIKCCTCKLPGNMSGYCSRHWKVLTPAQQKAATELQKKLEGDRWKAEEAKTWKVKEEQRRRNSELKKGFDLVIPWKCSLCTARLISKSWCNAVDCYRGLQQNRLVAYAECNGIPNDTACKKSKHIWQKKQKTSTVCTKCQEKKILCMNCCACRACTNAMMKSTHSTWTTKPNYFGICPAFPADIFGYFVAHLAPRKVDIKIFSYSTTIRYGETCRALSITAVLEWPLWYLEYNLFKQFGIREFEGEWAIVDSTEPKTNYENAKLRSLNLLCSVEEAIAQGKLGHWDGGGPNDYDLATDYFG